VVEEEAGYCHREDGKAMYHEDHARSAQPMYSMIHTPPPASSVERIQNAIIPPPCPVSTSITGPYTFSQPLPGLHR